MSAEAKKSVIVLGNGESRNLVDISRYRKKFHLIGCNAIHRDVIVDHLVCCDQRMVAETLNRKKSSKISSIYTRKRYFNDFNKIRGISRVKELPELPYKGLLRQDQEENWGSGPYAILLAANLNYDLIYILGFDLYGINGLINNIYKNTINYNKSTARSVDYSFWIYQIRKIFVHYPNTKFKIVNLETWKFPDEWKIKNVEFESLENFRRVVL